MKIRRSLSALVVTTTFLAAIAVAFRFEDVLAVGDGLYSRIRIFTQVLDTIQRAYVEERNPDELLDDALRGMLAHLDPHSTYLPAEQFDSWTQNFEGYTGIGIGFDILGGQITVMSVMEGSPSDRVGLQPGDRIVAINDHPATGLKRDEVPRRLMGPIGSAVAITVERQGWPQPRRIELLRDRIVLKSIPHAYLLDDKTGYVKIDRFTSSTARELNAELRRLEQSGMKRLLLDLRGNSGGYLSAAVDVCDSFLPEGKKIVYTKGRSPSSFQEYFSTSRRTHPLYPVIVLIDHATASASEIVAGALQDWDRALIVGKASFGKGLVQSQYRFSDGSALLLTTARYYTPSGRLIQRNYGDKSREEYYADAYLDQATLRRRISHLPSYKTASGRIVYGGGGIMPDVWIEGTEPPLPELVRRVLFAEERYIPLFAVDLIRSQPALGKRDPREFAQKYVVGDDLFGQFVLTVRRINEAFSWSDLYRYKSELKFLIKREIAYVLWGERGRFLVNMERDSELRQALEHFEEAARLLFH